MNHKAHWITASILSALLQHATAAENDGEALQRVSGYHLVQLQGDDEVVLEFNKQSALNWSNPVFGTKNGGFFIWTHDARVAAVMKTYMTKNERWFEQVRSFSTRPIVARVSKDAAPFWQPPAAPDMQRLPESPKPAATATARLVQMKALHRSFTVNGKLASGPQALRPLPRQLYRYSADDVIDGALFAYVQGTGPDVLLILEAREVDGQSHWHYSIGSIGIFEVDVQRNGKTVWSEPRRTAQATDPTDLYDGRRLETE